MILYGIYFVYISNWWPRYLTCFRKSRRASQWNMKGKNMRLLTHVALNRGGLAICKKLSPVVRKSKWRNKDVLRQLSINQTRAQHCAGTQGCFTCNKVSWNRLITSKSVFCDKIEHRSRHVHHCSIWVQMSTFIYHNIYIYIYNISRKDDVGCAAPHTSEFLFTGIGKRPIRRTHHLWTFSNRGFTRRGSKWMMLNDLRIICDTLRDRKRKPPFLIQALTEQSAEQSICFRAFLGSR